VWRNQAAGAGVDRVMKDRVMEHNMPYDINLERRIRERAFQIWIEEGQPRGRDKEHWLIAEAELVSGTSPPLQPDQPIGQISQAQEQAQKHAQKQAQGNHEPQQAPSIVGGTNPDDITR
jgi:DUF2934 family protein